MNGHRRTASLPEDSKPNLNNKAINNKSIPREEKKQEMLIKKANEEFLMDEFKHDIYVSIPKILKLYSNEYKEKKQKTKKKIKVKPHCRFCNSSKIRLRETANGFYLRRRLLLTLNSSPPGETFPLLKQDSNVKKFKTYWQRKFSQ